LLLLSYCSAVSIGCIAKDDISSAIRRITNGKIETPKQCENLTMKETAYCLNDYITSIYKYKIRKDIENPTLEELIEEGGDCEDWTELYMKYIDNLGFDVKGVIIKFGEDRGHTFAVISDGTGYCLLDQMVIDCYELED